MAGQLGVPENKVSAELSRFAANGLLVAMSVAEWDRRMLYERATPATLYWKLGLELIRRAAEEEALRTGLEAENLLQAVLGSFGQTATADSGGQA
jgi:hypothetical protein